jgi:phosphoribosylformylglycinamidine synthase
VVLEAARNVACAGAEPRALVNCLNFGNPEHPEVMWQFAEVIDGMAEACTALGIPVVGGNVSFYNTSEGRDIDPTPVVGVVGIIESLDATPPGPAITPGHHVVVLGATGSDLGGSEWAAVVHGLDAGSPPPADLGLAASLHGLVADLVANRRVSAVHDVADGGLAVALTEMAIAGNCGLAVVPDGDLVPAAWCFAESASRVVVTAAPVGLEEVLTRARDARVPARDAGMTGGQSLVIAGALDIALADARDAWHNAIPRHFET